MKASRLFHLKMSGRAAWLISRARRTRTINSALSMRAVGDESRPSCQYEEGSLLARTPAGCLIYKAALGGERYVPLEAALERNCVDAEL